MAHTEIDEDGSEFTYNDNGKLIHLKVSDRLQKWWEYDNKGRITHYRHSDGYEQWFEFAPNGRGFHSWDSDGDEMWMDYTVGKLTQEQREKLCSFTQEQYEKFRYVNPSEWA